MDFERRAQPALKTNAGKHVVLGIVYEPDVRDTDGNFMKAEEIEKMAYRFMEELRNTAIDKEHNGETGGYGTVVESFIARDCDPDFPPGAWVLGVHVTDAQTWEAVEKGEITDFFLLPRNALLYQTRGRRNEQAG